MITLPLHLLRLLPFLRGGHPRLSPAHTTLLPQLARPKSTTARPQTRRTFLSTHRRTLITSDLLPRPALRLPAPLLLAVRDPERTRVLHFNVPDHLTAAWSAQPVVATFPDDPAPPYLL